ncbi:oxidoreductase [Thermocladium modestius]|uniref:Oxidoreductase n=1 Tax=Thermocladium modestius TaxID=62609 RepID=A0A830GXL2_9CREN|nr:FAD/NAD(P)-binding protein [Thermocladium modestius]GGP20302.1 oxidoreductase [Thermocladium modestius]
MIDKGMAKLETLIPLRSRIVSRKEESLDTVTLGFDRSLPSAMPGQFIMASTTDGEVPISLAGENLITFKRVGRTTGKLHGLGVGDFIGIRGPYGNSWPSKYDSYVILAGGIGIPPIRFFMDRYAGRKDITLLYGARNPSEIIYRELLMEEWPRKANVLVTVDRGDEGWRGNVGVVTSLLNKVKLRSGEAALIIGPEVMMMHAVKDLLGMGMDPGDVYLSLERHMECGVGFCGHCNIGKHYVCVDGPIFSYKEIKGELAREGWPVIG